MRRGITGWQLGFQYGAGLGLQALGTPRQPHGPLAATQSSAARRSWPPRPRERRLSWRTGGVCCGLVRRLVRAAGSGSRRRPGSAAGVAGVVEVGRVVRTRAEARALRRLDDRRDGSLEVGDPAVAFGDLASRPVRAACRPRPSGSRAGRPPNRADSISSTVSACRAGTVMSGRSSYAGAMAPHRPEATTATAPISSTTISPKNHITGPIVPCRRTTPHNRRCQPRVSAPGFQLPSEPRRWASRRSRASGLSASATSRAAACRGFLGRRVGQSRPP